MLNFGQLPPTILHPSPGHQCRRPHRLHSSNRTAPRTRRISVPAESCLALVRRIAQGAACPSHLSSVELRQALVPRHLSHSHRPPPTHRSSTTTACSRPRPDAPSSLAHDQISPSFVASPPPTGQRLPTPREHQTLLASLPAHHQVDRTVPTARPTQADSPCRPRTRTTSPPGSHPNAFSDLRRATHWLEMSDSCQEAYHLVRTASPTVRQAQPNGRERRTIHQEGVVAPTGSLKSDAERWENNRDLMQQSSCGGLAKAQQIETDQSPCIPFRSLSSTLHGSHKARLPPTSLRAVCGDRHRPASLFVKSPRLNVTSPRELIAATALTHLPHQDLHGTGHRH